MKKINPYLKLPLKRIHIELTSICNFNCTFCPKSFMTRRNGYIETTLAKKIISEIAQNRISEKITFHIMGEPFLHPDFFEIIQYAVAEKVKIGVTTNGSYLTEANSKRLIAAGLDQINISLQTPSEETFKLRQAKGIPFASYLDNILNFIKIASGSGTVIKLHILNTRFAKGERLKNKGDINVISTRDTLKETLSELSKKIYSLSGISDKGRLDNVLKNIQKIGITKWNVLEIAPNIFFETYMFDTWGNSLNKGKIKKGYYGYCSSMSDHFGILWNGDLILCCKDFDGKTKIGNISDSSIMDILNSEKMTAIMAGFKRYKIIHPHCQTCMGGGTVISSLSKQVGSVLFFDILKWYFYNQKRLYE